MKKILYFLFAITLLAVACSDDDDDTSVTLNLDGDNETAPRLLEDTYEAAAQFSASQVGQFAGQQLTEVLYYMYETPLSSTLKIYGPGNGNIPGALLYEADLTGSIDENDWNTHVLSTPITLSNEELWISIRLRHGRLQQSIGCDAGPTGNRGDWLFQESDGIWTTFEARTGGERINWNIRGVVEE